MFKEAVSLLMITTAELVVSDTCWHILFLSSVRGLHQTHCTENSKSLYTGINEYYYKLRWILLGTYVNVRGLCTLTWNNYLTVVINRYLDASELTENNLVLSLCSWDFFFFAMKVIIHGLILALRQHFANRL